MVQQYTIIKLGPETITHSIIVETMNEMSYLSKNSLSLYLFKRLMMLYYSESSNIYNY